MVITLVKLERKFRIAKYDTHTSATNTSEVVLINKITNAKKKHSVIA